ncbi:hypothetical protein BJX63DRAFT_397389 [Aspergillus granulosus]|uniref:Secreted protein n=1 Tax=Aspergillus granulosus TaxID=176169 RepID=A0ABR4H9S4_9EURO
MYRALPLLCRRRLATFFLLGLPTCCSSLGEQNHSAGSEIARASLFALCISVPVSSRSKRGVRTEYRYGLANKARVPSTLNPL